MKHKEIFVASKIVFMVGIIFLSLSLLFSALLPPILHTWLAAGNIEVTNFKSSDLPVHPDVRFLCIISLIQTILGFFGIYFSYPSK